VVSEILDHVYEEVDVDGEQVRFPLPFVNLNYRADVRISNFKPPDLRDFTFPRKRTEFDVLSDNGDSGSSSESEVDIDSADNYDWHWRFFLELEDAKAGVRGEKFWVVVDNQSAQCLLSLDATNLREDADALEELRQRMFVLWGNLEEVKSAQQAAAKRAKRSADVERPPLDSSDNEASTEERIANRAFPCCIRQYGVKVTENDPDQANAGEGYRWERVYGMFGTRILTSV
jgi:protection of telomeres protein 1